MKKRGRFSIRTVTTHFSVEKLGTSTGGLAYNNKKRPFRQRPFPTIIGVLGLATLNRIASYKNIGTEENRIKGGSLGEKCTVLITQNLLIRSIIHSST